MTERKFTRGLNKPGMAAQLRENISQVVRESASLVCIVLLYFYFGLAFRVSVVALLESVLFFFRGNYYQLIANGASIQYRND